MLREVTDLPTFHGRGRESRVIPDVRAKGGTVYLVKEEK